MSLETLSKLRESTSKIHMQLHTRSLMTPLLQADVGLEDYVRVLEGQREVYLVLVSLLQSLVHPLSQELEDLEAQMCNSIKLLEEDLSCLGLSDLTQPLDLPQWFQQVQYEFHERLKHQSNIPLFWGWKYVLLGSSQGAQRIQSILFQQEVYPHISDAIRYWNSISDSQSQWKTFQAQLTQEVASKYDSEILDWANFMFKIFAKALSAPQTIGKS